MRRVLTAVLTVALLVCSAVAADNPPPRLVVVVVLDQVGYEQLARIKPILPADSTLLRMMDSGANFTEAHLRHASTETAVGHSTLMTGAHPNTTGIVGNSLYDRPSGKWIQSVHDRASCQVGTPATGPESGVSPKPLLVPTVGDTLKLNTNRKGKVFGVSMKERSAILMAGHAADGAYFYHAPSGNWGTCQHYRNDLPDYVTAFNSAGLVAALVGKQWELSRPADKYLPAAPNPEPEEPDSAPLLGLTFPHALPQQPGKLLNKAITSTPFINELTMELALRIFAAEQLGADETPDLLCISLSGTDTVGHLYGPHSLEAQDTLLRADTLLGGLVKLLDAKVPGKSYVLVVTADHGVCPTAEVLAAAGLSSNRRPLGEMRNLRAQIEQTLQKQMGALDEGVTYIAAMTGDEIYLRRELPELGGNRFLAAQRIARDKLLEQPAVVAAFTRETLLATDPGASGLLGLSVRSFHPGRSGDVAFATRALQPQIGSGATHGSPWRYDTHVPLLLIGQGIRGGKFTDDVCPAQIAPTVADLIHVDRPYGCVVGPLKQAMGE